MTSLHKHLPRRWHCAPLSSTAFTDHLQSVREVVNTSGTSVGHVNYDSLGRRVAVTGTVPAFGYTGKLFDSSTGLQYNWHRWYDASVGRWISEDPIGFNGGDQNLFNYAANSPVLRADSTGLISVLGTEVSVEISHHTFWLYTLGQYIAYVEGENGNRIIHDEDAIANAVGKQPEVNRIVQQILEEQIQKAIKHVPKQFPKYGLTEEVFQDARDITLMNGDGVAFWLGTGRVTYKGRVQVWWEEYPGGPCVESARATGTFVWKDTIDARGDQLENWAASNGSYLSLSALAAFLEDSLDATYEKYLYGGFPVMYQWTAKRGYLPKD